MTRDIIPNRAKRKLAKGEPIFVPSWPAIDLTADQYEQVGHWGLIDAAWIEAEHGRVTWSDFSDLSRACDLAGITSLVRVYDHSRGFIGRILDRGIQGVLVPHVKTREDVENAVDAVYFAPKGHRGVGGSRQGWGVENYPAKANDELMVIVLLEEVDAIKNLDDILKVDGVDCFFLGPGDLGHSMGAKYSIETGGDWHFHPEVQKVVRDALKRIKAAGRMPGTLVREDNVEEYLDLGVRFLRFGATDFAREGLTRFKGKVEKALMAPAR